MTTSERAIAHPSERIAIARQHIPYRKRISLMSTVSVCEKNGVLVVDSRLTVFGQVFFRIDRQLKT